MNRFTSVLSCAALALASTLTAHATTNTVSYVSVTGNDTNPCTQTMPCLTIDHALTVTTSGGDVILATSGTYAPATISQWVTITAPAGVDASIAATTSGTDAITVSTTKNVTLNGFTLRGHGTGNDGILVESVGNLTLNNLTIQYFVNDGIEFKAADGELNVFSSNFYGNTNDGLLMNASGARAWVVGSAFDGSKNAGAESELGKLAIADSNAHYNKTAFLSSGGSVTLDTDRAIFNTVGFGVEATGRLHFAHCLLSDNGKAYDVASGGVLQGTTPGTTFIVPGQGSAGSISTTPAELQ